MLSLYHYRRYIWRNAVADLRHRYTGTALGIFWNVIGPLLQIAVYAVVFTQIMRMGDRGGASFVIYLCSGLLPWIAFAECVTRGTHSFVEHAAYLKKLPVPEVVFVAQSAVSATLSLMISLTMLAAVAMLVGHPPTWRWALVPVAAVLWQAFGFGLGLMLGTVNAFIRDVSQMLGVVLMVWMWTVPIVYLQEILPSATQQLLPLNPPYCFIRAIHDLFVYDRMPPGWVWPAMLGWAGASIVAGAVVLRSMRGELRDVL